MRHEHEVAPLLQRAFEEKLIDRGAADVERCRRIVDLVVVEGRQSHVRFRVAVDEPRAIVEVRFDAARIVRRDGDRHPRARAVRRAVTQRDVRIEPRVLEERLLDDAAQLLVHVARRTAVAECRRLLVLCAEARRQLAARADVESEVRVVRVRARRFQAPQLALEEVVNRALQCVACVRLVCVDRRRKRDGVRRRFRGIAGCKCGAERNAGGCDQSLHRGCLNGIYNENITEMPDRGDKEALELEKLRLELESERASRARTDAERQKVEAEIAKPERERDLESAARTKALLEVEELRARLAGREPHWWAQPAQALVVMIGVIFTASQIYLAVRDNNRKDLLTASEHLHDGYPSAARTKALLEVEELKARLAGREPHWWAQPAQALVVMIGVIFTASQIYLAVRDNNRKDLLTASEHLH